MSDWMSRFENWSAYEERGADDWSLLTLRIRPKDPDRIYRQRSPKGWVQSCCRWTFRWGRFGAIRLSRGHGPRPRERLGPSDAVQNQQSGKPRARGVGHQTTRYPIGCHRHYADGGRLL